MKFYIYSLIFSVAFGLYFDLKLDEKRCFLKEAPAETQMQWNYSAKFWDFSQKKFVEAPAGYGMHVDVTERNEDKPLLSRNYGASGKVMFLIDKQHNKEKFTASTLL
jgi:hypothetical protein